MSDPKNTPAAPKPNAPQNPPPAAGGVYFCEVSGARIVAPGVSREVDPVNGVDLYRAHASPKPR